MERGEQRRLVEALVLASPEPIAPAVIARIAPDCTPALVGEMVEELNAEYREQDRAFEIWEVAGGLQMRTLAEFSGYLQQLRKERPVRLSRAALETLSVIAYRQPVTRAEIEQVRGVDVGAVLKSLMERHLVRISGHREVPGRPLLYSTTKRFLEVFGLDSLKSLPTLRELEELLRERSAEREGEAEEAEATSAADEDSAPAAGAGAAARDAEDEVDEAETPAAFGPGDDAALRHDDDEAPDADDEPDEEATAYGSDAERRE